MNSVSAELLSRAAQGKLIDKDPRKPKLAAVVAHRIQTEIAKQGWPVGKMFGNEPLLMETYGVSRATLREAVRQLERNGVATMKRGAGGGLIVQEPARIAAVQALATYLELTDVSLEELFEANAILESQAIELAIQRLSDGDIAALRADLELLALCTEEQIEEEYRIHRRIRRTLAAATQNLAVAMFLEVLNRVTGALMPDFERLAKMWDKRLEMKSLKKRLVESVIAGDVSAAVRAVKMELDSSYQISRLNLERFKRDTPKSGLMDVGAAPQIADWDSSYKLPHRLAVVIAREVANSDHLPGERIGAEPEFLERFGVSRAVFREAIRTLEGYGIVEMRRGYGGGLVVGTPDPTHTISVVANYLSYAKLDTSHFSEVLRVLELSAIRLAAVRAPVESIQALQATVEEMDGQDKKAILKRMKVNSEILNQCAKNRAISLFCGVIHKVAPVHSVIPISSKLCQTLWTYQKEAIAAIARGDEAVASRKTIQLFNALKL